MTRPIIKVDCEHEVDAEIVKRIEKLHLENGDFLIIRLPPGEYSDPKIQERLENLLRLLLVKRGLPKCPILVVEGDLPIERLSEKDMERFGWIKREDMR